METTVSNKITILNFVCTLCICYYHFLCTTPQMHPFFIAASNYMCFIAMAVFFMSSGFLLFNGADSWQDMKTKLIRRRYTLLIPFLIWNTISIFVYWRYSVITDIITKGSFTFSFRDLINNYFTGPINGPTWYLLAVYFLSLVASLIIKIKDKKKIVTCGFVIVLVFLYLRSSGIIPVLFRADEWWWYYNLISYCPYFLIGCYIGLYHKDIVAKFEPKLYINIISLVVFIGLTAIYNLGLVGPVSYWVGFLIIISLWLSLPNKLFRSNLKGITQTSFFIYVMHIPIINPLIGWIFSCVLNDINRSFFASLGFSAIIVLSSVVICIIILVILKLIFFKSNKAFMLLSGGRVKNDFALHLEKEKEIANKQEICKQNSNNLNE